MSNELYALAYHTESPNINRTLQGVVSIFESSFPGRIRGHYLVGSFGNQSTVANSDLDMYVIFKEDFSSPEEAIAATRLSQSCALVSSVLLEIKVGTEFHLSQVEQAGTTLNFKHSTRFLYGEDIRNKVPAFTSDDWVQWAMRAPQTSLKVIRSAKVLRFPLQQPDAHAEFYGYERQTIPCSSGVDQPSTKWLVATVGWIATAIAAYRTKQYIGSKEEAVQLYKTQIGDKWTALVKQVYEQCRNHWNYLIPSEKSERRILRTLCRDALGFSNHYLSVYRDFALRQLCDGSPKQQLLAAQNLSQIIYPGDQEILHALERLKRSNNTPLTKAAYEAGNEMLKAGE